MMPELDSVNCFLRQSTGASIERLMRGEIAGTITSIVGGEIVVREVTYEEWYLPNPRKGCDDKFA